MTIKIFNIIDIVINVVAAVAMIFEGAIVILNGQGIITWSYPCIFIPLIVAIILTLVRSIIWHNYIKDKEE